MSRRLALLLALLVLVSILAGLNYRYTLNYYYELLTQTPPPSLPEEPPVSSASPQPTQRSSASSTPTEETTALEETTVLGEGTTAFQGLQEEYVLEAPPESTLSSGGNVVRVSVSASYCWGGAGGAMCADGIETIPPRKQTLYVPSGSEMVFRYEAPRPPNKVSVSAASFDEKGPFGEPMGSGGSLKAHGSGVERTIPAELPPGEYGVRVYVKDPQGDPHYLFRVMVE